MAAGPMPTPEDVKTRVALAYNRAADFYDDPSNGFWDRYGRRTIERLGIAPGSRVLDLCCGSGASALPAAEAVGVHGRVVAVDLAEALIRLGKEKASRMGLRNIDFRVADVLELEPMNGGFDDVVCVFGLFFVPDMTAAPRHMWSFLRPGGRLAVTTWAKGLFEPVNSMYWEAVRRERADLYKAFNPWDRLGEPEQLTQLFVDSGLPNPEVVVEAGRHRMGDEHDVTALLMGTGYRSVLEQLPAPTRKRVSTDVVLRARAAGVTDVAADVIYAVCRRDAERKTSA